jgi:hypothetical protein
MTFIDLNGHAIGESLVSYEVAPLTSSATYPDGVCAADELEDWSGRGVGMERAREVG